MYCGIDGAHTLSISKTVPVKKIITKGFLNFPRFIGAKVLSAVSPYLIQGFLS
jgi:hypothetical protein